MALTYDGSRMARGVRMYLNGEPLKLKVPLDDLNQTFARQGAAAHRRGTGPGQPLPGSIERGAASIATALKRRRTSRWLAEPLPITEIAAHRARKAHAAASGEDCARAFLDRYAPEAIQAARQAVLDIERAQRTAWSRAFPP